MSEIQECKRDLKKRDELHKKLMVDNLTNKEMREILTVETCSPFIRKKELKWQLQ